MRYRGEGVRGKGSLKKTRSFLLLLFFGLCVSSCSVGVHSYTVYLRSVESYFLYYLYSALISPSWLAGVKPRSN